MNTERIVEAVQVVKTYRNGGSLVEAVRRVTFSVTRGEFVALTGPSGSGKSTLLNMLACVETPTSGEIRIAGRSTNDLDDQALTLLRRTHIGYVFQFFNLLPMLTLRENVALPLLLASASPQAAHQTVSDALDAVGLLAQSAQRPSTLSGGQQQRAAIARAIVHRPELVLADEPTGNLDSKTGQGILQLLARVRAQNGLTVLLATHSAEAAAAADRVLRMRDGELVT
ncbi:MAG: ABC transporter ATP-binding protein [Candidatus Eremiobacteraeota bacterium]|nr:ABC transporter ATP-binding protein [Candidatus Eremiobacteraeota bacterium]